MNYEKKKVFSFQKSEDEEVRFAVRNHKGKTFGDIQVFHIDEDGSKIGTHKAIFLAAEKLPEMKEGIECLIAAIEKGKED